MTMKKKVVLILLVVCLALCTANYRTILRYSGILRGQPGPMGCWWGDSIYKVIKTVGEPDDVRTRGDFIVLEYSFDATKENQPEMAYFWINSTTRCLEVVENDIQAKTVKEARQQVSFRYGEPTYINADEELYKVSPFTDAVLTNNGAAYGVEYSLLYTPTGYYKRAYRDNP